MILSTVRGGCRRFLFASVQPTVTAKAGIKGKAARSESGAPPRPAPFPYNEKRYNVWRGFIDKTSWRFDENSKIIVVEGNMASGKTEFAKALAEDLDMKYLKAVSMDDQYINSYGFDLRTLDSKLPPDAQSCDEKRFLVDPKNRNVANFQIEMLQLKYMQYIDAVCHLLNTGQGVVIERSCFSDQVFIEAMYKAGYVSKGARSVYYALRRHTIPQVLKPHLVIYLDVPVKKVQENIKKRALPHELKSKVFTAEYLGDIERNYKEAVLPDMSIHAQLLVYDWSEGGDVEVVVEDIERVDFDNFDLHDKKLLDWRFIKEWDICEERIMYTDRRNQFLSYFNVPRLDVPELLISGDDRKARDDAYLTLPGNNYQKGYNVDLGDKVMFNIMKYTRPSPWL